MESLDDPNDRAAGLLAVRTVAEAYGGLGVLANSPVTARCASALFPRTPAWRRRQSTRCL